jgi:hypothetical protein
MALGECSVEGTAQAIAKKPRVEASMGRPQREGLDHPWSSTCLLETLLVWPNSRFGCGAVAPALVPTDAQNTPNYHQIVNRCKTDLAWRFGDTWKPSS